MIEYSTSVKLLTECYLEFLSLTGGYTGSSESTLVKLPHCWKSRVKPQMLAILSFMKTKWLELIHLFKQMTYELFFFVCLI